MVKEIAHKRHFLNVFRRWEALFKRADRGDMQADKWFIAEYYKSLGHLSQNGLEALTEELKERCTFFPTIRECLAIIRPSRFEYENPFYRLVHFPEGDPIMLEAPISNIKQLMHKEENA